MVISQLDSDLIATVKSDDDLTATNVGQSNATQKLFIVVPVFTIY